MRDILIVYYHRYPFPLRRSLEDHLYCFRRYSGQRCFYVNLAVRGLPRYVLRRDFDLVVFHTTFLGGRWSQPLFESLCRRAQVLKNAAARKVALPQDEFYNSQALCRFIEQFGIDCVFTRSAAGDRARIYEGVDGEKVKFVRVLAGYLDDRTVSRVDEMARGIERRSIDVGYRAWQAEPWLGRHGLQKVRVAQVFREGAARAGLVTDISNRASDTLLGDAWYRFLLSCKYVIGVEGGASVLDRDGSLCQVTRAYTAENPGAGFKEIEARCFPGRDGELSLFSIAPRHLEACATRTCQILVEGRYNDILQPGRHYVELKRDMSNLAEVLETVRDDRLREPIVRAAREDIVDSGRYSYRKFVQQMLDESLADAPQRADGGAGLRIAHARTRARDALGWVIVACYCWLRSALRFFRLERPLQVLLGRGSP